MKEAMIAITPVSGFLLIPKRATKKAISVMPATNPKTTQNLSINKVVLGKVTGIIRIIPIMQMVYIR